MHSLIGGGDKLERCTALRRHECRPSVISRHRAAEIRLPRPHIQSALKLIIPINTRKHQCSPQAGYWAKALAERYSIEKAVLHFCVNDNGEMCYGINGVNKGLF